MHCKLCASHSDEFGQALVLGKYTVRYYRCSQCGFIQTENPYWLDEAYSSSITKSDIGLVSRNFLAAEKTANLILTCFDPSASFIDYGGGYGMFVRLMRDKGFDFYRYDPLCDNLFADGFDAEKEKSYSLLTAWEVFEHLVHPLEEIEKMLAFNRNIFFSTILTSMKPKPLDKWWYYGVDHGQHIAIYSPQSLAVIAKKFDLVINYSDGSNHLLGEKPIHPLRVKLSFSRRFGLIRKLIARPQPSSLLGKDYQKITGNKLE